MVSQPLEAFPPARDYRYWRHEAVSFSLPDGTGRALTLQSNLIAAYHPDYAEPSRTTLVLHSGITFTVAEDEATVADRLTADGYSSRLSTSSASQAPSTDASVAEATPDVSAGVAEEAPGESVGDTQDLPALPADTLATAEEA